MAIKWNGATPSKKIDEINANAEKKLDELEAKLPRNSAIHNESTKTL